MRTRNPPHQENLRTWRIRNGEICAGLDPVDRDRVIEVVERCELDEAVQLLARLLDWASPHFNSAEADSECSEDRAATHAFMDHCGGLGR